MKRAHDEKISFWEESGSMWPLVNLLARRLGDCLTISFWIFRLSLYSRIKSASILSSILSSQVQRTEEFGYERAHGSGRHCAQMLLHQTGRGQLVMSVEFV